MSLSVATVSQIKAQLHAIHKKFPNERVVAVQTNSLWEDEPAIASGETMFRVYQCRSSLQIREALAKSDDASGSILILTELETDKLEHDLLARLARRRIFTLDAWGILLDQFHARTVSPRLAKQKWIAEFLLIEVSRDSYPAAISGVIDEETIWRIILVDKFGFPIARPDLDDLLVWTLSSEKTAFFNSCSAEIQQSVQDWIFETAGDTTGLVFAAVRSGFADSIISLGLVCEVVFAEQNQELSQAAARLERFFGDQPLRQSNALEFANSAVSVIEKSEKNYHHILPEIFNRAEQILAEIKAQDYTRLSRVLPGAFEARLTDYSNQLTALLSKPALLPNAQLLEAFNNARIHRQAAADPKRKGKVEMSIRLFNWLTAPAAREEAAAETSFALAAELYVKELSYVDWARNIVLHGDSNQHFSTALDRLLTIVIKRREKFNRAFGKQLAEWTEKGSSGSEVWRIEEILSAVVAPAAKRQAVLLIVLDGMSFAAFHEILEDLKRHNWHNTPLSSYQAKPVIAALPSVTQFSRTSLFCGALTVGNSSDEARGFAENSALVAVCKSKHPPKLFHKAALTIGSGAVLTPELEKAIYSESEKIIGVLVNSIDDHLAKGEQIAVNWNLDAIPLLGKLLKAAFESDRTVILTSDHGHIIEQGGQYRKADAGERYRENNGKPHEDEFIIGGTRVLAEAANGIIAPWSESVRYAKKKHGYHGGIAPQECVVPLAVLARQPDKFAAREELTANPPAWWNLDKTEISAVQPPLNKINVKDVDPDKLLPLFEKV